VISGFSTPFSCEKNASSISVQVTTVTAYSAKEKKVPQVTERISKYTNKNSFSWATIKKVFNKCFIFSCQQMKPRHSFIAIPYNV
jgi:hypothetical protein